jgi:hypothetical protein
LANAIEKIYTPAEMQVTNAVRESESAEYEACRFELNGKLVVFRVAKTTPTKMGQFVTIWKREQGKTVALDSSDGVHSVVIDITDTKHHGQFIFNQQTLISQGVMSHKGKKGKAGIRVYPPWVVTENDQAKKTQRWQLQCFLPFAEDGTADLPTVLRLFKQEH